MVVVIAAFLWPWSRVTHHLNTARQALERGDPRAALVPLQVAEKIQPHRAEVQYLLAVAYRRAGQFEAFRRCLQRAADLNWPAEELERQNWQAVAQTGDVDTVRERLMETIAHDPPDQVAEEIYEAIARGYLASYRLRDAWRCLDMWLRWRPNAPQARMMRAYVYDQLDQVPAAIEDYRAAVEGLPASREARLKLAELLFRQGAVDEANSHYRACLAADAGDAEAFVGAARCAQSQGDAAEARRCVAAALALHPEPKPRADALTERGRLLLAEGTPEEAIEALTEAVQLAPAEIPIHRVLAAALTRVGQAERAKFHFDRAAEIQVKYNRLGDIQRALIEKPNDAELRCEAGRILIEQGLTGKGVGWLRTALDCAPNHRPTHELLAECYATAGNQALAAQHRVLAARSSERTGAPASDIGP
jgi:tetratricopeptide (TPR) repeat protein